MKKIKRILALLAAILLAGMYLTSLILAIFDQSKGMVFFMASLLATAAVPVLLWAYQLIYRLAKGDKDEDEEKDK